MEDIEEIIERKEKGVDLQIINQQRIRELRKRKIKRNNRIASIVFMSALMVAALAEHIPGPFKPSIPEGYHQAFATYQVEQGDTIYDIAKEYYDEGTYDLYYKDFNGFVKAIQEVNHVDKQINPYQNLSIPVIANNDNVFAQRIQELEQQLDGLTVWVNYEVQAGDTILGLAYKGAGTTDEAYAIKDEIMSRNHLGSSLINQGDHLYIVNPEIGKIKTEIEQLKEKYNQSLKVNYTDDEFHY